MGSTSSRHEVSWFYSHPVETPFKKSSSSLEGKTLSEVRIDFDGSNTIVAIHFVLKEVEMGAWFQHRGRDFRIPCTNYQDEHDSNIEGQPSLSIWPGALEQISGLLVKPEGSRSKDELVKNKQITRFYEEYPILKEELVQNSLTVAVKKSNETHKNLVQIDADIAGNVVVHWGVCRDNNKRWEVPSAPHPPSTKIFRQKALQTLLQPKADGLGSWGLFPVDKEFSGISSLPTQTSRDQSANEQIQGIEPLQGVLNGQEQISIHASARKSLDVNVPEKYGSTLPDRPINPEATQTDSAPFTDEIISEIRNLVTRDISLAERKKGGKSKEVQENILQEIEKLAAEAYSIFRTSIPTFVEEAIPDAEQLKLTIQISPRTGSGYEVLCQGFNWESHRSGRWYSELKAKASELASMGFTVIWLPPPTESVSPEGYMPKDLYNLNSRPCGRRRRFL